MALEDDIDAGLASMRPHPYNPDLDKFGPCHRWAEGECTRAAIPGTNPPACKDHGGAGSMAKAAAALRLEAARLAVQAALEPAIVEAVQMYLRILRSEGPYIDGTTREVEMVSNNGKVIIVEQGVKINTRDMITAADRILALAGMTPETAGMIDGKPQADDDETNPVMILRRMLEASDDSRLERLAKRLGALPAEAKEIPKNANGSPNV